MGRCPAARHHTPMRDHPATEVARPIPAPPGLARPRSIPCGLHHHPRLVSIAPDGSAGGPQSRRQCRRCAQGARGGAWTLGGGRAPGAAASRPPAARPCGGGPRRLVQACPCAPRPSDAARRHEHDGHPTRRPRRPTRVPRVVDASVAVKWLVEEDGSDRAEALKAEDLHALPDPDRGRRRAADVGDYRSPRKCGGPPGARPAPRRSGPALRAKRRRCAARSPSRSVFGIRSAIVSTSHWPSNSERVSSRRIEGSMARPRGWRIPRVSSCCPTVSDDRGCRPLLRPARTGTRRTEWPFDLEL